MSITPELAAEISEGELAMQYEDWECSYMPHTWVPNSYSVPDHSQWELSIHSVQLTQRKHIYEDPIGRERVEVGMRMYRCSGTIDVATGEILIYKPQINQWEESVVDMANWPTRLYRKVGSPLLLVVESMQESAVQMHINLDYLISGEKACTITVGKFLIITWGKMKRLVDEKCTNLGIKSDAQMVKVFDYIGAAQEPDRRKHVFTPVKKSPAAKHSPVKHSPVKHSPVKHSPKAAPAPTGAISRLFGEKAKPAAAEAAVGERAQVLKKPAGQVLKKPAGQVLKKPAGQVLKKPAASKKH